MQALGCRKKVKVHEVYLFIEQHSDLMYMNKAGTKYLLYLYQDLLGSLLRKCAFSTIVTSCF